MPAARRRPLAWHRAGRRCCAGVPFWCDVVAGEFTHIGTTRLFRQLMTERTTFSRLYAAQQRLGMVAAPGLRAAGMVVDSVLSGGGVIGPGAIAIECDLTAPVTAAPGAILHGLTGLPGPVRVPADTVVHQVPVVLPDGKRGIVIRAYGVADDPKAVYGSETATWFGRPLAEMLDFLGLAPATVWPDAAPEARSLWNAACSRWGRRKKRGPARAG